MTVHTRTGAPADVGQLLRTWRERRRLSQLELANIADVSARHVSFIETGRSVPSVAMIIRLADRLDVPIRDRNALLLAAGYAPTYAETSMDAPEMAPMREIIDQLLQSYDPYPALVFDARYDIVAANRTVNLMLDGVAGSLLEPPINIMRLALHPDGLAKRITNLHQVRAHLLARFERHLDTWQSDHLQELYDEVRAYPVDGADGSADEPESLFALPMRLRHGDVELSFISTVSTFNTPLDVTVSELAIETFLPADPQTAKALSQA